MSPRLHLARRSRLRLVALGISAFFIGLFHAASAVADDTSFVTYKWVDVRGNLIDIPGEFSTQWVWNENKQRDSGAPAAVPVLRVWFDTSSDYSFENLAPETPPFTPKGNAYVFELVAGRSLFSQNAAVRKGSSSAYTPCSVVVLPTSSKPAFLIHSSCVELGLRLRHDDTLGNVLYAAISCEQADQGIRVFLHYSEGARVDSQKPAPKSGSGARWLSFLVPAGDLGITTGEKVVESIRLASDSKPRTIGQVDLIYAPADVLNSAERRLSTSTELGLGFLSYDEPYNADTSVNELALRAKFRLNYTLLPKKIDLTGEVFLDLVPVVLDGTPPPQPGVRGFGMDAAVGYWLPFQPLGLRIEPALSWVAWGMWAQGGKYGVAFASGPGVVLSVHSPIGTKSPYATYAKYSLSPQGFSAALGGRIQIRSIAQKPVSAVLETTAFRGNTNDGLNPYSGFTVFPGLHLDF